MKHLFIPYELALHLKEKGFDEDCLAYYTSEKMFVTVEQNTFNKEIRVCTTNKVKEHKFPETMCVDAPLYQQVITWFKEQHNIKIHEASQDGWFVRGKLDGAWITLKEVFTLDEAIEEALKLI